VGLTDAPDMKRIGLAYNPTNGAAIGLRERALAWCAAHGLEAWAAQAGATPELVAQLPGSDALIVLGGDGTFLRAALAAGMVDVPILGINSGKVGFLSKAEAEALDHVLAQVADGAYDLEPRMMLEARVLPGGAAPPDVGPEAHLALNEAAVVRGSQARVVRLEVMVDDTHVATYICDGVVVSSPTGSTGYSFSAGGPILEPTARNLVVTPVAAYLSAIRSVVVGPQHAVTVRVLAAHDCLVSIDGREEVLLQVGDTVRVTARARPVRFIEPHGAQSFYELLRRKAELLPS
jgi:NAD+ kinase